MSDNMNSRSFARAWLEKEGLFDKDRFYDGALGEQVMAVVELVASQGHSVGSAAHLYHCLQRIFWESDEGKSLEAQFSKA